MTRTATSIPSSMTFSVCQRRESLKAQPSILQPNQYSNLQSTSSYEATVNLRRRIQSSFSPSLHTANHHFSVVGQFWFYALCPSLLFGFVLTPALSAITSKNAYAFINPYWYHHNCSTVLPFPRGHHYSHHSLHSDYSRSRSKCDYFLSPVHLATLLPPTLFGLNKSDNHLQYCCLGQLWNLDHFSIQVSLPEKDHDHIVLTASRGQKEVNAQSFKRTKKQKSPRSGLTHHDSFWV